MDLFCYQQFFDGCNNITQDYSECPVIKLNQMDGYLELENITVYYSIKRKNITDEEEQRFYNIGC